MTATSRTEFTSDDDEEEYGFKAGLEPTLYDYKIITHVDGGRDHPDIAPGYGVVHLHSDDYKPGQSILITKKTNRIVCEEWADVARADPRVLKLFDIIKTAHIALIFLYMLLELTCIVIFAMFPFQPSVGECLEAEFPVALIIILLLIEYIIEEIQYYFNMDSYFEELLRWTNPRRWHFRAIEAALIFTFISSLACSMTIFDAIAVSIFEIGGIVNFLEYQVFIRKELASRALRYYYTTKNAKDHYRLTPKRRLSLMSVIMKWFGIFFAVFPPLFALWFEWVKNPDLDNSNVSAIIWGVYTFGIIQAICIIAIPIFIERHKNDATLFLVFLRGELATMFALFLTKVGLFLFYILGTRLS